jgi:hypothetical protein
MLQYGLLAGGLADGSICLWNPAAIVDGSGQSSLLTKMQKHTGAVSILFQLQHTICTASVALVAPSALMSFTLSAGERPGVQHLQSKSAGFWRC